MGATIATEEIAAAFAGEGNHLKHVFTYSGHPVSAAAGLKNIELIQEEGLVAHVAETGVYLRESLQQLQDRHPLIGDVRGIGFMQSIDLVADRQTRAVHPAEVKLTDRLNTKFKDRGLLLKAHGGHILNLSPPLCTTRENLDEILSGISESLSELETELG